MDDTRAKTLRGIFFPVDIILVTIAGVWFIGMGEGIIGTSRSWQIIGIGVLLMAPGYALTTALFPERSHTDAPSEHRDNHAGIIDTPSTFERVLLAVGCSVALIPLVGIVLEFITASVTAGAIVSTLGGATVAFSFVGALRRLLLPKENRYSLRTARRASVLRDQMMHFRSMAAIDVILVVGFVVAAGGLGAALLTADHGENFTEFELTTVDPDSGDHIADGYPNEIQAGDDDEVWVGISNNEGESMEYTVVIELQAVGSDGEVTERESLDRFTVSLEDNETWRDAQTIAPTLTGDDIRIVFLLYKGEPPADGNTNMDDAYRHAHFWVTVPE